MKKNYFLTLFLLFTFSVFQANAQREDPVPYFVDDFADGFANWTNLVNGDPTNPGWVIGSNPDDGNFALHYNEEGKVYDDILESIPFAVESEVCRISFDQRTLGSEHSGFHTLYIREYVDGNPGNFQVIEQFVDETFEEWLRTSIDILGYNGKTISIAFGNSGSPGVNWSIDNVEVFKPLDRELEITSFVREGIYLEGEIQYLIAKVKNTGAYEEPLITVNLQVGAGVIFTEDIALDPLEEKTIIFDELLLTQPFEATVQAEIAGDPTYVSDVAELITGPIPDIEDVGYGLSYERNDAGYVIDVALTQTDMTNFPNSTTVTTDFGEFGDFVAQSVVLVDNYAYAFIADPNGEDGNIQDGAYLVRINMQTREVLTLTNLTTAIFSMVYDRNQDVIYSVGYGINGETGFVIRYFTINPDNGEITIIREIPVEEEQQTLAFRIAIDRYGQQYGFTNEGEIRYLNNADYTFGDLAYPDMLPGNPEFIAISMDMRSNTLYSLGTRDEESNYQLVRYDLEFGEDYLLAIYERDDAPVSLTFPSDLEGVDFAVRIIDGTQGVEDATLYFRGLKHQTNEDGYFNFQKVKEGVYDIRIIVGDDYDETKSVTVTPELDEVVFDISGESVGETDALAHLQILPNPANHELRVEGIVDSSGEVYIYDLLGQPVKMHSLVNGNTIPIEEMEKGIYFLKIKCKEQSCTRKLVVE